MNEAASVIKAFLGCPCEYFAFDKTGEALARFRELQQQGRQEGFWPLMVGVSDTLLDALEDLEEQTPEELLAQRQAAAAEAEELDGGEILAKLRARLLEDYSQDELLTDDVDDDAGGLEIGVCLRRNEDGTLIAKVPCKNPWELALWMPMGGFNDCPVPVEQAAVFRHWHDKYGAAPAAVTYDVWELEVARPPSSQEDALELAWEQFSFCSDIVTQGAESVSALAAAMEGSGAWYFWWD